MCFFWAQPKICANNKKQQRNQCIKNGNNVQQYTISSTKSASVNNNVIEKIWWKKLFQRKPMLDVQEKPGLVHETNVTKPDQTTTTPVTTSTGHREEIHKLATDSNRITSQMTKSQTTTVNEATSSSADQTINPNEHSITNDSTYLSTTTSISSHAIDQSKPYSQQQQPQPQQQQQESYSNVTNIASMASTNSNNTRPARRTANDYRFGKTIGEGSFSSVYIAQDIHTKKEVAIKVCEKQLILREKKERYVKREREVMHILSNTPGFVSLSCTFHDAKNLYFVMTLAKNGDLLPYINKVGSFDFKCTQFYAAELILAIEHMHRKGIVHRDLKPENILLNENMHTLIADFGSARILDEKNGESDYESRRRTNSFVGTAYYVSPEILKGEQLTKAADLWALGCIVYQMISGLPPFRAGSEYLIFQKILERDLNFPDGFNKLAKDLVQRLIQIEPCHRLGAEDQNDLYESIRNHEFFDGIIWDKLRQQTPPPINPYLPGLDGEEEKVEYRVPEHLEPGLGDEQLRRLLELELGTSNSTNQKKEPPEPKEFERTTSTTAQPPPPTTTVTVQKDDNKWQQFVENEVIVKQGLVNKRKGLFARKRMLLLTTGPRLFYIDPVQMVKKGEIPMSSDLRCEPRNFKIFFVHTPNRTYYLEDPEGYALEWCQEIDKMRQKYYDNRS